MCLLHLLWIISTDKNELCSCKDNGTVMIIFLNKSEKDDYLLINYIDNSQVIIHRIILSNNFYIKSIYTFHST